MSTALRHTDFSGIPAGDFVVVGKTQEFPRLRIQPEDPLENGHSIDKDERDVDDFFAASDNVAKLLEATRGEIEEVLPPTQSKPQPRFFAYQPKTYTEKPLPTQFSGIEELPRR